MSNYLRHYQTGLQTENYIALTFDDGPNPHFTPKILDVLSKYNIKATFFLIGKWAEKYPELVLKIFNEGHTIGNHTYSHDSSDFKKADDIFFKILGFKPRYFRLPGIDFKMIKNIDPEYLKRNINVTFDVDSWDFKVNDPKLIYNNVIKNVKKGSIIDFHDGSEILKETKYRPRKMLAILPKLLTAILEKKLTPVKLEQMTLVATTKQFKCNEM